MTTVPHSSLPEGAFVWTRFPFGPPARPDLPGPIRHIAYVLGARHVGQGIAVLLAYTSSGRWRGPSATPPLGVIEFTAQQAKKLNQRPFHLDLRCLARVPASPAWFPELDMPHRGIVAIADPALQARILRVAKELAERSPEIIEIRGMRT